MGYSTGKAGLRGSHQECEEAVPRKERIATTKVNVGLRGICGRPRVRLPRRSTSPRSPSPPPRTTGRRTGSRSTRCQGPPPCTSPRPVSPVAAAARSTTVANFGHEMVLMSAGCKPTEVSSQPGPTSAGLNRAAAIQSARGRMQQGKLNLTMSNLYLCNHV